MSFTIRNYIKGDEKKILELFSLVFKKEMTLDYWKWRFENNPYGPIEIALAFDGDKLIAHYAISPISFHFKDKDYKAAHSMTTMTHPEYQGRGLFNQLASFLYSDLKKNSYDFVWGFPNLNSYYGFMKNLNWSPLAQIPTLKCSNFVKQPPSLIDIELSEDTFTDIELNEISPIYEDFISIKKTSSYFSWRYTKNPGNTYTFVRMSDNGKLAGLAVTKEYSGEIDLLETFFSKGYGDKAILSLKEKYLGEMNSRCLNAWPGIQSGDYLSFLKNNFVPSIPITNMGFLEFNGNIGVLGFGNPLNWNISMGDSDVY